MKDIKLNIIWRWGVACLIIMLSINIYINPVSATYVSYNMGNSGGTLPGSISPTTMYFNHDNFDNWSYFKAEGVAAFSNFDGFRSSGFSISSGGTGSGTVIITNSTKTIEWTCVGVCSVSGITNDYGYYFTLEYTNISAFSGITLSNTVGAFSPQALWSTLHPMTISYTENVNVPISGTCPGLCSGSFSAINYTAVVQETMPESGSIIFDAETYTTGALSNATVTLTNPDFNSHEFYLDVYYPDGTLYNDFQLGAATYPVYYEIYLSVPGTWTARVVEVSHGSSTRTELGTDTAIVNTQSIAESFISFQTANITLGQTSQFSWGYSNDIWSSLHSYDIEVYHDNVWENTFNDVAQFGTRIYYPYELGVWKVKLNRHYLGVIHENIAESNLVVTTAAAAQYSITTQGNTYEGQSKRIDYYSSVPVTSAYIVDTPYDSSGWPNPSLSKYTQLSCPCTGVGNKNITFTGIGKHKISFYDSTNIIQLASKDITILSSEPIGGGMGNFSSDTINTDYSTYPQSDTIFGSYTISNTSINTYNSFKITLTSSTGIPLNTKYLSNNIDYGSFSLPVLSGSNFGLSADGTAYINLTGSTNILGTSPVILATKTLNILAQKDGYFISASPKMICQAGDVTLRYDFQSAGKLKVAYVSTAGNTISNTYDMSGNGTRIFNFAPSQVLDRSAIIFDVYDGSDVWKVGTTVQFLQYGCSPTTTPGGDTGGDGAGSGSETDNNNTLVSFFLIALSMGYVAFWTSKRKSDPVLPSLTVGFFGLAVFTKVGMIAPWIFFSILLLIIALIAHKASSILKG